LVIKGLHLKFGSSGESNPLSFDPNPVTVFVGPNNSGKSLILREIEEFIHGGGSSEIERKIINALTLVSIDALAARMLFEGKKTNLKQGDSPLQDEEIMVSRLDPINSRENRIRLNLPIAAAEVAKGTQFSWILRQLVYLYTIRLDGRTRFGLTEARGADDLQKPATSHLMALFLDDEARKQLRDKTYEAFGLYFTIDPSAMTQFRIRMSSREPSGPDEEQGLTLRARKFQAGAAHIEELSDGIKAFTGLLAAVMCADYRIMLIDEPEAFLHPPLAKKLGQNLTELAASRQGNVLASTHSPDFLMGCIQAGAGVNIVRLTYDDGFATARLLAADSLNIIMRDPLMRSTGILAALFHKGAVVCEADSDRAFYQEINERLLHFKEDGFKDSIFLNAQNKQTVYKIASPLRKMGIPAAVIVDLDILKGGGDFKNLLKGCCVPDQTAEGWAATRAKIYNNSYKAQGLDPKRVGLSKIDESAREALKTLISNLEQYGIFVLEVGELEKWLPELAVSGHGPSWLINIFEKMGSDPSEENYIKPKVGGVWDFVSRIGRWISNPKRNGMPG